MNIIIPLATNQLTISYIKLTTESKKIVSATHQNNNYLGSACSWVQGKKCFGFGILLYPLAGELLK